MVTRVVFAVPASETDPVQGLMREYFVCKNEVDSLTLRLKELRDAILEALADRNPDEQGHITTTLSEPYGKYAGVTRQRRVSRKINEEVAMEYIRSLGLAATKTIEVVDEEAVWEAVLNGVISDAILDEMYPPVVTYALQSVKA